MPYVAQVAVGRREQLQRLRQRLRHARRHRRARLHPRGRPGRRPCRRAAAGCSTTPGSLHRQPGHRPRLQRARGGARLRARQRPAGALPHRAAPPRRRGRLLCRPGAGPARCSAGAPSATSTRMCADSWRWQSMNPNGFEPRVEPVPPESPMTPIDLQPVIMAGGSGTRLWPLSRAQFPEAVPGAVRATAACSSRRRSAWRRWPTPTSRVAPPLRRRQRGTPLPGARPVARACKVEPRAVLLEPMGRNTAPAMTLAALQALDDGADPVLVVTPADQTVTDDAGLHRARCSRAVRAGGRRRDRHPRHHARPARDRLRLHPAPRRPAARAARWSAFVEKPDLATAQRYLAEGGYFWNSGMFVLRASVWLAALEHFRPDIAAASARPGPARSTDAEFVRPGQGRVRRGARPNRSTTR